MLFRETYIRRYDWDILFFFNFDSLDEESIIEALYWADAPESIIRQVSKHISAGDLNQGFCFSTPERRISIVGISKTDSGPEFLNTSVHEIVHVSQHIANENGIDPFSETFAYIVGGITEGISPIVCEMSCPHCRCE